jgi:uracil phosphoribosyltransferase
MPPGYRVPSNVNVVNHPLVRAKLTKIRDEKTPSDQFRNELNDLSMLMAFEVTRTFETVPVQVKTPLAVCDGVISARPVIVAPILRAGLGMVDGMLSALTNASVGHIGMYRNETTLRPESYYFKLPAHLGSSDVIVVDPMLATGSSATAAIQQLKESGARHIRYVCIVSCPAGLDKLASAHPDVPIFTAVIDDGLDENAYILPGLGDAGDRYFGTFSHRG